MIVGPMGKQFVATLGRTVLLAVASEIAEQLTEYAKKRFVLVLALALEAIPERGEAEVSNWKEDNQ